MVDYERRIGEYEIEMKNMWKEVETAKVKGREIFYCSNH